MLSKAMIMENGRGRFVGVTCRRSYLVISWMLATMASENPGKFNNILA